MYIYIYICVYIYINMYIYTYRETTATVPCIGVLKDANAWRQGLTP